MKEKQDVLKLHLLKEKGRGLGIQLTGNDGKRTGIFISHVLEESVADRDGRLEVGDEILFINGHSLVTAAHKEAVQLLQSASNPVQLVISRKLLKESTVSSKKFFNHSDIRTDLFDDNVNDNNNNNNNVISNDETQPSKYHTKDIILINGHEGKKLGFSLSGGAEYGSPLVVKNILAGGIAALDGRLRVGNCILKVNDIPMKNFQYSEAVSLFKSLKKGPIKILVQTTKRRRSSSSSNDSVVKNFAEPGPEEVVLRKVPGKGLGIGFGQSSKSGIFIKYLAKGSIAAKNGSLQLRDQVVAINGIGSRGILLDDFHKILHNLRPGEVRLTIVRTHHDSSGRGTMTPESLRSRSGTGSSTMTNSSGGHGDMAFLMSPAVPLSKQKKYYSNNNNDKLEGLRSAILLNGSEEDDDDDDYDDFEGKAVLAASRGHQSKPQYGTDDDDDNETKLTKKKKSKQDGWLKRNDSISATQQGPQPGSSRPGDMVVEINNSTTASEQNHNSPLRRPATGGRVVDSEPGHQLVLENGLIKVVIERDKSGSLGLSIKMKKSTVTLGAHNGVYAKNVAQGGSAERGGVKSGDEIVEVNRTNMAGLSYGDVISFFKKIPKKTTFVLKRGGGDNPKERVNASAQKPHTFKSRHHLTPVPNQIEDDGDHEGGVPSTPILRNSVLKDSFRTPKLSGHQVDRASTFKIIGREGGIGVPLPESGDVPDDHNVHLLEIQVPGGESLGISLVPTPSTNQRDNIFQIRQIQPTSVCVDLLYCTDIIHSVNGISFKGISHAQALQILKQCGGKGDKLAKFVVLRDKNKTEDVARDHHDDVTGSRSSAASLKSGQHRNKKAPRKQLKQPKATDALPGTIANEMKSHLVRPTLHRRTTDNSSLNSIPTLSPSLCINTQQNRVDLDVQNEHRLSTVLAPRSDDDNSSNFSSSNPGTPTLNLLPKCYAVNERSTVGAFLITKEKSFKSLGLDVMVDELGLCHVTDILKHGMFADDKRVRVGDNLLAINNEPLSGKPVSFVRNVIRSVPRGEVQVLIRSGTEEDGINYPSMTMAQRDNDNDSFVATTFAANKLRRMLDEPDPTEFSLPLPSDTKSKVPTQRQTSFSYLARANVSAPPPNVFDESDENDDDYDYDDDNDDDMQSDVMSVLPPAPPKPIAPSHMGGFGDEDNECSDNESCFSVMPAPPPPLTNFTGNINVKTRSASFRNRNSSATSSSAATVVPPKKLTRKYFEDGSSVVSDRSNFIDDNDDGDRKSDFYMPPPPPPLMSQGALADGSNSSEESEDDDGDEINRVGVHHPPTRESDGDEFAYKKRMSIEIAQRFVGQNAVDSNNIIAGGVNSAISSPVPTEIYYPKSYHQQNNKDAKKKSFFSRLKSKLLLPSKGDISAHAPTAIDNNPTNGRKKEKGKKQKQQQQRPLSAADFRGDTSSRGRLKASISQPDLVTALQQEDVENVDRAHGKPIRKFDSLDGSSFIREYSSVVGSDKKKAATPNLHKNRASLSTPDLTLLSPPSPSISGSSLSMRQLPRILSFRKSDKKKKKTRRNSRQNVSPPRTPPPPPPSDTTANKAATNDDSVDFGPFSPYDVIPSPTCDYRQQERDEQIESPYEVIDKFRFTGGADHQSNSAALSESSGSASQGRCSYAAEGPSSILKDAADECSFENVLRDVAAVDTNRRNFFNLNNNGRLIVDKPPPPPMCSLQASPILTSRCGRAEEIGMIETEDEERPTLKKRGSSLLSLNFPPPPPSSGNNDKGDNQQSSPIATSSVENSFEISDDDDGLLPPGLDSPDLNSFCPRGRKDTTLSDRDREDPKLQPFILTVEYNDQQMVSPRDSGTHHYGDHDDDYDDDASDWGSEFSSSVVDRHHDSHLDLKQQQAAATSRYASQHRANMFNVSIKASSSSTATVAARKKKKEKEVEQSAKKRSGDGGSSTSTTKRKNIFSNNSKQQQQQQPTQSQDNKAQLRPKTANKEKRKQVKSLPANLPKGKGDLGISQPVLVKRQTFAEIFSAKEVNAMGAFPGSQNPSLDDLVSKTIRKNLGDPCAVDGNNPGDESILNKTNPVPKPPRRGTNVSTTTAMTASSAENPNYHTSIDADDPCYENIQKYFNSSNNNKDYTTPIYASSSDVVVGRPVPPIPAGESEDEFRKNNTSLTEDELNQLYATVDVVKRNAERMLNKTNTPNALSPESEGGSKKRREYKVSTVVDRNGMVQEGIFKVKLVRESGRTLGLVITGGSDTPVHKILIREVDNDSPASACSVPLKVGDELLEVNGQDVTDLTHHQVLTLLQNSPPLINLTMQRCMDSNESLLSMPLPTSTRSTTLTQDGERHVKDMATRIDSQAIIASLKAAGGTKHSKKSELIAISERRRRSLSTGLPSSNTKPNLSVDSFDALLSDVINDDDNVVDRTSQQKINKLIRTPPLLPKHHHHQTNTATTTKQQQQVKPRSRTTSVSSTNINVSVTSPMKATTRSTSTPTAAATGGNITWLEIDLYKQPGRGLGIAVTGGPKHIITDGIRVKRLIPESIASLDGRLRKNDRILIINGRDLKGMTQGDALTFLKDIPKVINLGVKRESGDSDEDVYSRPTSSSSRRSRSGSVSGAAASARAASSSSPAIHSSRPQSAPHGDNRNSRGEVRGGREDRSRPQSREQAASARRSRSETRDTKSTSADNPKATPRKRPSSVSRLSRFFRGSSESINSLGKDDKQQQQQQTERKRSGSQKKNKNKSSPPLSLLTIIFDKTDKHSFDFTLTGGVNTVYGDLPILIQSVRKGSELYKSLKVNDELVSIQGIDVSRFPVTKVTDFLSHLPVGRVCMVVQRKN